MDFIRKIIGEEKYEEIVKETNEKIKENPPPLYRFSDYATFRLVDALAELCDYDLVPVNSQLAKELYPPELRKELLRKEYFPVIEVPVPTNKSKKIKARNLMEFRWEIMRILSEAMSDPWLEPKNEKYFNRLRKIFGAELVYSKKFNDNADTIEINIWLLHVAGELFIELIHPDFRGMELFLF